LHGNLGIDVLDGGNDDDLLYGEAGNDTLIGNAGNDALRGGDGKDIIIGGEGQDYLFGGAGADRFIYTAADLAASLRDGVYDLIADFSRAEKDRIDLSALDANSKVDGNQSFKFVAGGVFHKVAGELIAESIPGGVLVQGDTNGDGRGDFAIQLRSAVEPIAADFVL
jgi:Ca2+-binding RTX toxin-like protein